MSDEQANQWGRLPTFCTCHALKWQKVKSCYTHACISLYVSAQTCPPFVHSIKSMKTDIPVFFLGCNRGKSYA